MKSRTSKAPYILMTPGPAPVPQIVLDRLSEPMEHHRTPNFEQVFQRIMKGMKYVFQTNEHVFLHGTSGSGAMESAIVNTLSPGDHVVSIETGKFGERFTEIAQAYGMKVTRLQVPWGQAVNPAQVAEALKENSDIKAVLCQACETSTATVNPIREIAELVKDTDALFIVDAITALGAMPLPMDEWHLDVVISGSQKAMMLPTGMSFIALSKKAWKMVEVSKSPKFYLDLKAELKANLAGETRFSSNVPIMKALDSVLELFESKGLSHFHNRTSVLCRATHVAAESLGLKLLSSSPSSSVTAICMPEGIDGQKVRSTMETDYKITVMGGQDQLKGRIIRIGHMGAIKDNDLLLTIEALADSINKQKPGFYTGLQIEWALVHAERILGLATVSSET